MASFEVGDTVEVHGLLKSVHLNGQIGTLTIYDSDCDRWGLDIAGGAKKVKAANLRADFNSKHPAGDALHTGDIPSSGIDRERARSLKELGNAAVKQGRWPRALSLYLSADAIADRPLRTTLASNLSLVALKLADPVRAAEFARQGLALEPSGTLATKLQYRLDAAHLTRDVVLNYQASLGMSQVRPTKFTSGLASAVYSSSTDYFATGTFVKAERCSFLATINVGACIVIFAWSRTCNETFGFGAHVPLGALLHGCMRRFQGGTQHVLQELVDALKGAFAEVAPEHVEVHMLGGHAFEETNAESSLKLAFFRNEPEKQRFSWHVKDAVRAAGFNADSINAAMATVFQGGPMSAEAGQRLMKDSQHVFCAALHMETGGIVTHTDFVSASIDLCSSCVTSSLWPARWLELEKGKGSDGASPMRGLDA